MILRRFTSTLVAHATKDGALRRDSVEIKYQVEHLGKTMKEVDGSSRMGILQSLKDAVALLNSMAMNHYRSVKEID